MNNYPFTLPSLGFDFTALEPIISSKTLALHHGQHLKTYINNLNALIEKEQGQQFLSSTLEEIVLSSSGSIFSNAAQTWNHIFYFSTLSKDGQPVPTGELLEAIDATYSSFEIFKSEFERLGSSIFGSGWIWLSKGADGKLVISQESNAGNPMREGLTPLLVFDVWEHAYYVDYQNRRAEHLSHMWNLVDWRVVENRFASSYVPKADAFSAHHPVAEIENM